MKYFCIVKGLPCVYLTLDIEILLWLKCVFLAVDSGAFGVVHRAVEKSTGRAFVAKFVNTPQYNDKNVIRNEVNVMNQLHHPKLLNLHDAFEDKHEMVLILE